MTTTKTITLAGCFGIQRQAVAKTVGSNPAPVAKTEEKPRDASAAYLLSPSAWAVRNHGVRL